MEAKLFCKFGEFAGREFDISDEATIGTDASNTIVLKTETISGNHARIFFDKEEKHYFLEDLGSINGTRLDRIKVTQKEKLGVLHAITFANEYKFIFQAIKSPEKPTPEPSTAVEKSPGETIFDEGEITPTPDLGEEVKNKTIFDDKVNIPTPEVEKVGGGTVFDDEPIKSPQIEESPPEPSKAVEKSPGETIFDDGESTPTPDLGEELKTKTVFDDKDNIPTPDVEKAKGATVFDDEAIIPPQIEQQQEQDPPEAVQLDTGNVKFPPIQHGAEKEQLAESKEISPSFELFFKKLKKTFELKEGENIIGRGDDCDIFLDDRSVSQPHAALIVKSGKVFIKDLQSKNKTFIRRKEVEEETELEPGSKIRFGGVEAKLISKNE